MRYLRILSFVASGFWAIEEEKGKTAVHLLMSKAGLPLAWDDDETPEERRTRRAEQERRAAERQRQANGGVAVLPLYGIISPRVHDVHDVSAPGGVAAEAFAEAFRQVMADPQVTGVVIDVDSPGGNVLGVPEAFAAIRDAKGAKPVWAIANHQAASAAYWLASAADRIVVTPSGEVGSIGVYSYHEDVSKALEMQGVTPSLIKAGPNKAEGHPAFPLGEEATAHIQGRVDDYYGMFVRDVAKGRAASRETVREGFGGGRMVGAQDAVRLGMADEIDTLENTIRRVSRAASKPKAVAETHAAVMQSLRRRLAVA
jgi:signal peptide peptidase SppA